jgi:lysophospholipase-2
MNMGMPMPSWYDITGLDERANENCRGLEESQARIQSILEKEHETSKLKYDRMVLAGFSQGGALSLFTGLNFPHKLAGLGLMSGYLPAAKKLQVSNENKDTPVWHGHGNSDPMVTLQVAEKSRDMVLSKGATKYELKSYSGLQHSVNMEEIGDFKDFLLSVLPPDDTCKVQLKDPSEMSVKELKAAIRKAGLGSKAVGLMEKAEFVKLLEEHRGGATKN